MSTPQNPTPKDNKQQPELPVQSSVPTLSDLISQKSPPTSKSSDSLQPKSKDTERPSNKVDTAKDSSKDTTASKSSGDSGKSSSNPPPKK